MSSSPKFVAITLMAELAMADRAGRDRRAAARRQREADRAAEFTRRLQQRAERAASAERASISSRLDEVSSLLAGLGHGAPALAADIAALRDRLATETDPGSCAREAEALRGHAIALRATELGEQGMAGRQQVITELRRRLAGPGREAALLEPARHDRCTRLLGQLEAAAARQGVQFDALHGTVEHEIASYAELATAKARAARARLDEAADLLETFRAAAESAISDARALAAGDIGDTLAAALSEAVAALAAGRGDPAGADTALAQATRLARLLPESEARLDELTAAYERRAALAEALKDVLAEQGMSLLEARDTGDRFILQFERPGGALYTAAVDDGEGSDLTLSYAIDGEADIPVLPAPGAAVCDQTEAFLDAVHADLASTGYRAGQLLWEGKPRHGSRMASPRRPQQDAPRERRQREAW